MVNVQFWQIALIVLYGFFINYDKNGSMLGTSQPVVAGLYIGGTLQLMTLGISSFGGASVPDYQTAALIGTYIAITTGQKAAIGITLAIPVAMLMVELDVLKWTVNIYFQNRAERYADEEKYSKIELMQLCGVFTTMLASGLPVLLTVIAGPTLVKSIITFIPQWVTGGLTVAGNLLPALGIGLLLRYLPVKSYFGYLVIGFIAAVYLKMTILGIALAGAAIALILYKRNNEELNTTQTVGGVNDDE